MPTYEYRCKGCGHEFEEFQSITAAPLKKCPSCAKARLERLIGTGAAVMFKGGGFYETDYRSESYKKAAKADAEAGKPASDAGAGSKGGTSGGAGAEKADKKPKAEAPKPAKPGAKKDA